MSRLERRLGAGELVVTAEMPVIDGGGLAEIQRQLAPMKPVTSPRRAASSTSTRPS